jgi:hypothetical protein
MPGELLDQKIPEDLDPFGPRSRGQPTKAELRKQGEAALRQWKARNGLADTQ